MAHRKSVVLVTVDCLRADHCGFMGYRRPTTPFLDVLAKESESFVFPTAIVAGVPTYYSFPAMLASRYPLALGREVLGLGAEETNLASAFKQDGYATAFFGAGNPYLSAQFGYGLGFDTFRDFLDRDLAPLSDSNNHSSIPTGWAGNLNRALATVSHKIPGVSAVYDELYFQYCQRRAALAPQSLDMLRRFPAADVLVDQVRTWLASVGEKPFFLWLHFMDPHSPYYPTEEALESLGGSGLNAARARYLNESWNRSDIGSKRLRRYHGEVTAMYDAGIRWVDAQLSQLTEALRRFKLWQNCIFAFTADHGEEFLEHDGRYHAPSLTEELIHVPLLLRVPGAAKQMVCNNPFSLLHLAPTLLAAAGSPVPADFQGQSYWTQIRDGTAWSEPAIAECVAGCKNPFRPDQRCGPRLLAIREARYKLVLNFDTHQEDFFDLATDPGERSPLPREAAKAERRRLLETALAHLRDSARQRNSETYLRTRLREIRHRLTNALPQASARAAAQADPSRVG
ncbi:MAG: sulfatase-like hydrolase/transferase [Candidatus Sulfotelmatobacter sp.]